MEAVQKCENLVVLEKIMLKNAYLGAKIGFDTAANELSKVCPLSVYRSPRFVSFGSFVHKAWMSWLSNRERHQERLEGKHNS